MDSQDVAVASVAHEFSANKKTSFVKRLKSFFQSSLWLVFCIVSCFYIAKGVESLNQIPSPWPFSGMIMGNIFAVIAIFALLATSIDDGKIKRSFPTARRQISVAIVFVVLNEYIEPHLPAFLVAPEEATSIFEQLPYMGYVAMLVWCLSQVADKDENYKVLRFTTTAIWALTFLSFLSFIFLTYSNLVDDTTQQQMLTTLQNLTSIIEELV